jgi:hypothetical protein
VFSTRSAKKCLKEMQTDTDSVTGDSSTRQEVTISETSRNERPSSFSVRKTLFRALLTKCYSYCKIGSITNNCL